MKMKSLGTMMSGGIDSTMTIIILRKLKLKYKCFNFININSEKLIKNIINIINIANFINIKIKILNYKNFYIYNILNNLIRNYLINFNINPDVLCNKFFKFNIIIKYIKSLNYKKIITGHYSNIIKIKNYNFILSKDIIKDQNFFLNNINNKYLKYIFFPLGYIKKIYLYKILNNNLIYKEKESKGICFVENKSFKVFINKFLKKKINYILYYNKILIGLHIGNFFFTLGQKKYIKLYNINNRIYIYKKYKNKIFIKKSFIFTYNYIFFIYINFKFKKNLKFFFIKMKHTNIFFLCKLKKINKNTYLMFLDKFNTQIFSLGQIFSIFSNNICLGGGVIIYY